MVGSYPNTTHIVARLKLLISTKIIKMMYEREFQLPLIFDDEPAGFVIMDVAEVDPSWRGSELNIRLSASMRGLLAVIFSRKS